MKSTVLPVVVSFAALAVAVLALVVRPRPASQDHSTEARLQALEENLNATASSLRETDSRLARLRADVRALSEAEEKLDAMASSLRETGSQLARVRADVNALSEAMDRLARVTEKVKATAAARSQAARISPGVKFRDKFEKDTCGWFVYPFTQEIIGKVAQTTQEGHAKDGRGALSLSYTLQAGKFPLTVRTAGRVNRLSFWIRTTQRPAEVYVGAYERDESGYGTTVHLEPAQGWQHLEIDFAEMVLDERSKDENAKLDFAQITSVAIADVSGFMGGRGPNTLLIDEVVGEYRKPAGGEGKDRF